MLGFLNCPTRYCGLLSRLYTCCKCCWLAAQTTGHNLSSLLDNFMHCEINEEGGYARISYTSRSCSACSMPSPGVRAHPRGMPWQGGGGGAITCLSAFISMARVRAVVPSPMKSSAGHGRPAKLAHSCALLSTCRRAPAAAQQRAPQHREGARSAI